MTPRSGLKIALAGFLLTLLCGLGMAVIVLLGAGLNGREGLIGLVSTGSLMLLVLGAAIGHITILGGLIIAGITALTLRAGKAR